MDRLDAAAIVVPGVEVRVVERCGSTNDLALQSRAPLLIAAEEQTAGRGRRGRRWHSALGASITFSLARRISRPARELPRFRSSPVSPWRARRGARCAVRLKWPNDLEVEGASSAASWSRRVASRRDRHRVMRAAAAGARPTNMPFLRDFTAAARNQVIQHCRGDSSLRSASSARPGRCASDGRPCMRTPDSGCACGSPTAAR